MNSFSWTKESLKISAARRRAKREEAELSFSSNEEISGGAPNKESTIDEAADRNRKSHESPVDVEVDVSLRKLAPSQLDALSCESFTDSTATDVIKVQSVDFRRILDDDWISSEVMESFVFRLNERSTEKGVAHFMLSPDFFRCLMRTSKGKKSKKMAKPKYTYSNVKKCLTKRGINISELNSVMLPVCINENHWVLLILDFTKKNMIYYDPMTASGSRIAEEIVQVMKRWVRDEFSCRVGSGYAKSNFKNSKWRVFYDVAYPRQEDSQSCGIFVLYIMELLTRNEFSERWHAVAARPPFIQTHVPLLRKRLLYNIRIGFK